MSKRKRIYLCLTHISDEGIEQKYIKEAFDTNCVVPLGPNVNGFEHNLEEFGTLKITLTKTRKKTKDEGMTLEGDFKTERYEEDFVYYWVVESEVI